jgi:hypothetical protein
VFDYDDDGWPDIYVACDSTPSILYHNNHDGTFTDVAVVAGAAFNEDGKEQAGMGSTIGDYNGDGKLDIFKTNFSDDTSTLYRNNGDGTFDDVTFAAGLGLYTKYLGWGTVFVDVDNDGWPDLLLVNGHVYPEVSKQHLGSDYEEPRVLYHNLGNGKFEDISASSGPGITTARSSRGLAVGDLWNDGRMSVVVSNMNEPLSLLVNQVKSKNHWIGIKTVGTKSNRDGIGAKIRVQVQESGPDRTGVNERSLAETARDKRVASGEKNQTPQAGNASAKTARVLVDEVRSGSSFDSNNDMRVHFGLGSAAKVDWVEVRWPSGLTERFEGLAVDGIRTVTEGKGKRVDPSETAQCKRVASDETELHGQSSRGPQKRSPTRYCSGEL